MADISRTTRIVSEVAIEQDADLAVTRIVTEAAVAQDAPANITRVTLEYARPADYRSYVTRISREAAALVGDAEIWTTRASLESAVSVAASLRTSRIVREVAIPRNSLVSMRPAVMGMWTA